MAHRISHFIQAAILTILMFALPAVLLPESLSYYGFIALWLVFVAWGLFRAARYRKGPLW